MKSEYKHEVMLSEPDAVQPDDSIMITCRIIPIWLSVLLICFLLFCSTISWLFLSNGNTVIFLSIVLQVSFVPVIIYYSSRLKLKLTRDGIKIMGKFHQSTMFNRLERSWADLHSIRLRKVNSVEGFLSKLLEEKRERFSQATFKEKLRRIFGKGWWYSGFLAFDFKSGGMAPFPLAGFSAQGLEDLFIAISRWADPMVMNPDVLALERDVLTGQSNVQDTSFTRMWEESLRQQFEVTNFVPLQGGQELRGGSIKIMMLLACGGMSAVYLARLEDGTRVVVKEMRVQLDDDPEAAEEMHKIFAKEAQILSKLEHSNIVQVRDHFVENQRDYLVLEYVPGLTLRQHVEMHGPFSEKESLLVARQIAGILEYLHGFDPPILHRDLTPDNLILMEPSRDLMLVDFGAANEFVGNVTGTLIGKQCYIPPEQFRGKAEPASDIYAACATLYFILTGKDPEPISASRPSTIIDTVSDELDDLIFEGTSEDPLERSFSAKELNEKVQEIESRIN